MSEVIAEHGDFGEWFTRAMAGQGLEFHVVDAMAASLPEPLDFDGILITGSLASAYASRGLIWAALGGELVASQIEGEPLPVEGDLAAGAKGRGPFDVIVVEGAFEASPDALLAELGENGRLVGVDARNGVPEATLIERLATGFGRRSLFETRAATLEAFHRAPSFTL